eukprot:TRINITY_DN1470_c0_g1_i1.p1 TRINITY_DN1470_c0_g1~~TRINITY_DN1470_c0_g1_i1.p1  ORF type:complete len:712 (-),score=203.75 TRINITY_DN1470_c0_g1_i1:289-2424(-)
MDQKEDYRNTKDYHLLRETISHLSRQKEQCMRDIDQLEKLKMDLINNNTDPTNPNIMIPKRQMIANVPYLDFSKYILSDIYQKKFGNGGNDPNFLYYQKPSRDMQNINKRKFETMNQVLAQPPLKNAPPHPTKKVQLNYSLLKSKFNPNQPPIPLKIPPNSNSNKVNSPILNPNVNNPIPLNTNINNPNVNLPIPLNINNPIPLNVNNPIPLNTNNNNNTINPVINVNAPIPLHVNNSIHHNNLNNVNPIPIKNNYNPNNPNNPNNLNNSNIPFNPIKNINNNFLVKKAPPMNQYIPLPKNLPNQTFPQKYPQKIPNINNTPFKNNMNNNTNTNTNPNVQYIPINKNLNYLQNNLLLSPKINNPHSPNNNNLNFNHQNNVNSPQSNNNSSSDIRFVPSFPNNSPYHSPKENLYSNDHPPPSTLIGIKSEFSDNVPQRDNDNDNAPSEEEKNDDGNSKNKKKKNRFWTAEEQKRLEELLIEFPEEEVRNQRYAKISKALGTKTTAQVYSRVNNYFTKLALAGLEVPGKIPEISQGERLRDYKKKTDIKSSNTLISVTEGSETVFSKVETLKEGFYKKPIVLIEENENDNEKISLTDVLSSFDSNNTSQVVQRKVYYGIICACCNVSPIVGLKYSCKNCFKHSGELISVCDDCFQCKERMQLFSHDTSHTFQPCEKTSNNMDLQPYVQMLHFVSGCNISKGINKMINLINSSS